MTVGDAAWAGVGSLKDGGRHGARNLCDNMPKLGGFMPHCSPCMPLGDQSAELVVRAGFASGYWGVVP